MNTCPLCLKSSTYKSLIIQIVLYLIHNPHTELDYIDQKEKVPQINILYTVDRYIRCIYCNKNLTYLYMCIISKNTATWLRLVVVRRSVTGELYLCNFSATACAPPTVTTR